METELLGENEEVPAHPDNGAGIFMEEEDLSLLRDVSEVEMKILNKLSGTSTQDMMDNITKRAR